LATDPVAHSRLHWFLSFGAGSPVRTAVCVAWLGCCLSPLVGCANNPYALQSQVNSLQQEQIAMNQRTQELQTRASTLDHDNQELESLLAQARQQSRIMEDQVAALRDQLGGATEQLARLKQDNENVSRKAETLTASMKRRSGATITANNSLEEQLSAINIPGVEVRADGDVIRIELPCARLFEPGGARLRQGAGALIDQVAAEMLRAYPNQVIGVEGHTDSDAMQGGKWANNHQLSIGCAMAVYDHLVNYSRVYPGQLFVVGHGANHPVVSNGTPAGKDRNRRVELVIYPERVAGR
jgi:flagellar motor protein MotB